MKCPGQDTRYWKPGAIFETGCPNCGHRVEFFKDESTRKCKKCGHRIVNPKMDFGCAAYCKFAEQCLGELPPELLAERDDLLKDRVAIEMKRYFIRDFTRIGHANRVAQVAEKIVKEEKGDPAVVLSAAYLHDIGVNEAEAKHHSTDPQYLNEEGLPLAREILARLGAREDLIDEVCRIIEYHHNSKTQDSVNSKVFCDADRIVALEEEQKSGPVTAKDLEARIEASFLTRSGREMARHVLLNPGEKEESVGP
jgi:HD superfamily phosphodiesterase